MFAEEGRQIREMVIGGWIEQEQVTQMVIRAFFNFRRKVHRKMRDRKVGSQGKKEDKQEDQTREDRQEEEQDKIEESLRKVNELIPGLRKLNKPVKCHGCEIIVDKADLEGRTGLAWCQICAIIRKKAKRKNRNWRIYGTP